MSVKNSRQDKATDNIKIRALSDFAFNYQLIPALLRN
jgi:hypothetical protein